MYKQRGNIGKWKAHLANNFLADLFSSTLRNQTPAMLVHSFMVQSFIKFRPLSYFQPQCTQTQWNWIKKEQMEIFHMTNNPYWMILDGHLLKDAILKVTLPTFRPRTFGLGKNLLP